MIRRHLFYHLKRVEKRIRRYRLLRDSAICWLIAACAGFALLPLVSAAGLSSSAAAGWIVAGSLVTAAVLFLWNRFRRIAPKSIAHAIEQRHPDLEERLLTAVEQQSTEDNHLSYLQQQLVSEVLVHHRRNNWLTSIPASRFRGMSALNFAGLALLIAAAVMLYRFEPEAGGSGPFTGSRLSADAGVDYGITIDPGDKSIERGTGIVVIARFARKLPADVTLVLNQQNEATRRIPLSKSLDDPLFGGQVSSIGRDATYYVEYDDLRTRDFKITVFDFPELKRADAAISYPAYTELPQTVIPDARSVSFVEGSTVTLTCLLNKPVASARLIDEDDERQSLDLEPADERRNQYSITLTPRKSRRFRLHLVDTEGRRNKYPPEFDLTVLPNQRPKLELAFPARDLRVSPLEEMPVEGTAWDDFGLKQYGVIYALAEKQPATVVLGENVTGKQTEQIHHQISFEQLDAEPDQLVSYYLYADDFGPDGELRRTFSDMFFAEVRHFEEIFREGRQPPGGAQQQSNRQGGGQSQQAEQLAQLQKQILNATWNVYRRETAEVPGETFASDVTLIEESQASAIEKVGEIEKKVTDAKSKALVKAVAEHMQRAADSLGEAVVRTNVEPLSPALGSEQAAYQALLKLRAREHQVTRSQNSQGGGGGGGGGNRSQQQLNNLELSNKENRYRTNQNAAQPNATPANREQMQVLNRLRELARRQGDLNQKIKELKSALDEAKTEEEKEEIQRRLKRLQEEEQQMLRDVEELQKRMDRPENQSEMAESRRQLDKTRSRVLQSSEALKEGRLSQALNEGTRAERDLKTMREEFRRKTAGRFSEEMRDMKNRAAELSENEQKLAQELEDVQNPNRRTLRDSRRKNEIAREFKNQKDRTENLLDRMRKVVEQAEETEPLLSKQLYETIRKSREEKPQQALDLASELVNRGLLPEAEIAERAARRGIDSIKEGIDKAADGVLGNELDALKQARDNLENLSNQLGDEIAQADPQNNNNPDAQRRRSAQAGSRQASEQNGKRNPADRQKSQSGSREAQNQKSQNEKSRQGGGQQGSNSKQSKSQSAKSSGKSQSGKSQNGKSQSGKSQNGKSQGGKSASSQKSGQQGSSGNQNSSQRANNSNNSGKSGNSSNGKSSSQQAGNSSNRTGQPNRSSRSGSLLQRGGFTGGEERGPGGVIAGDNYQQWSDRMRDVEEMIPDPKLRAEAEKIRERARSMRVDFKRHSKEPKFDLVRTSLYEPLVELQKRLNEEIARRESKDALVPIDRDPVPERFDEIVRRYYRELSRDETDKGK